MVWRRTHIGFYSVDALERSLVSMFEYHGWIMVRDAPEIDDDGEQLDHIYHQLEERVKNYDWITGFLDLRWLNLYPHVFMAGLRNHYDHFAAIVFELFNYISEIAPDSYGILYTRNVDTENKFRVYVLSRGTIKEHDDPFLSPFIPVVEDPPT